MRVGQLVFCGGVELGRRRERGDPLFFTGPSPACVSSPPGWVPLPCALACVGEGLQPGCIGWRWPAMADCGDDRAQDGRDWISVAVDWVGLGVAEWGGCVGRCRRAVDPAQDRPDARPLGPNGAKGSGRSHPEAHGRTARGVRRLGLGQAGKAQGEHGKDTRRVWTRIKRDYQLPYRHPVGNRNVSALCGGHDVRGYGLDGSRVRAGKDARVKGAQRRILRSLQIA